MTENTSNYYYNCYNDQTVNTSVPPQAATPDLIAERIARELRTLGMAFNYAVRTALPIPVNRGFPLPPVPFPHLLATPFTIYNAPQGAALCNPVTPR